MTGRLGFCSLALAAFALTTAVVPALAQERVHYIAAVEVTWNYAPTGHDVITGKRLSPYGPAQIGWAYRKAVYREYTDASFTAPSPIAPVDRYRGIVGPTIYAEAGDTIVVHFKNLTTLPMDIAPGGLQSVPRPSKVLPGGERSYRWPVRAVDGPGPNDESSILLTYFSDVRQTSDELAGLIGPLVVTKRGMARIDGSPVDVDREITVLFSSQLEALNPFIGDTLRDPKLNPHHVSQATRGFIGLNAFPTINGYVYGNMPMITMRVGEHVRWYLLSTQDFLDGHAPTWDGQTVTWQGNRSDVVDLSTPHLVVDMVPDNPGVWLLMCSVNVHLELGLKGRFRVRR